MNPSEQILRLSEIEADYISKPIVPGIECVGKVADASDTNFTVGQKVTALMGGTGRSFNGSYAEYALLPAHHVFAIESELPWERLAAVPETYFTAWGSLFECLQLKPADTLRCMVKGGIVCHTGLLDGVYTLDSFDPIKEIPNGVYLAGFFSNYPTQQTVD